MERANRNFALKIIVVLSFLTLTASNVSAGYIRLQTTLDSNVEGKTLKVKISVVNNGDESAYNVQSEIKVADKVILAEKMPVLPVNSHYAVKKNISLTFDKPGTYPLALTMHYTDANNYPFSAVTCRTFVYKKEAIAPIIGQAGSASFAREGELGVTLKNLSDREITTKINLLMPRELTADTAIRELIIAPQSAKKMSFDIKNFSALAGSDYRIFVISELEDKEMHYSIISSGTINISASRNILGVNRIMLIIIAVLLLLIFIGAQFFRKMK